MLGDIRQGHRYELPREGFGILVCVSSHFGMIRHMLIRNPEHLHVFPDVFFFYSLHLYAAFLVCVCVYLFCQLLRIWYWPLSLINIRVEILILNRHAAVAQTDVNPYCVAACQVSPAVPSEIDAAWLHADWMTR